ncbi:DUF4178 domain-containing protein [Hymenobacter cellulosilyticus]|uniref:DUF4178 domain-containing protein n=1 Tax=Hymenobacter cellulosilyticus TaxID=2932248 RepID=A0A8T9QB34_9BACT|nr:DUF4178 domain-containing protein [Hymenobacter cellulosilyticus]UOQ74717.1 DUF4178 domain-containing protein [Hymenobacter cellulosilyticus]
MSSGQVTSLEARVACPSCLAQLTYYDPVNSIVFGCPECHTLFRQQANGSPERLKSFQDIPREAPILPLGSIGTLPDGRLYRVMGYMLRKEAGSPARWLEFMLFNPDTGYAQLAVYEGHWTFIQPSAEQHKGLSGYSGNNRVALDGDTKFNIYNKYQPRILYAAGEFDWNILEDERLTVTEFVAPPRMLVEEKVKGQAVHWFRAEHLEPQQVAQAFGLTMSRLPYREGVGAVQPMPGGNSWSTLKNFTLLLLILTLLTELVMVGVRPRRQLLSQEFVSEVGSAPGAMTEATSKVQVSNSFDIQDGPAVLDFALHTSVNNTWLELPVSLVNEQTGQGFEFSKSIEHYSGVEDGYGWSEGSVDAEATLDQVPPGRYHLNLYPSTDYNRQVTFSVTITENPWVPSNLLLFMLALLIYPTILYFRRHHHEQQRWDNSNFPSPHLH